MKRLSLSIRFGGKTGGFTLIEMMITLAIFILLSAAVFGVITSVLKSASILQDNQNRRDQIADLDAFLNRKLRNMPAKSILVSYRRGTGEGLMENGIIFGQDEMLMAVDAKLQSNGYYLLRATQFDSSTMPRYTATPRIVFEDAISRDAPGLVWTPLIHDVKTVKWTFQMLNATEWLEIWADASTKPNLVEFSMQQAADLQPTVLDFWLPHLEPVSDSNASAQPPNHAP